MSYKSLLESSEKTDARIEEHHLELFVDNIFLALEDTDKRIEGMQESIDSNKKDIREMLDRIKELVVDAR
jgi:peptidoglycan hydrolase CwlO-like protein